MRWIFGQRSQSEDSKLSLGVSRIPVELMRGRTEGCGPTVHALEDLARSKVNFVSNMSSHLGTGGIKLTRIMMSKNLLDPV